LSVERGGCCAWWTYPVSDDTRERQTADDTVRRPVGRSRDSRCVRANIPHDDHVAVGRGDAEKRRIVQVTLTRRQVFKMLRQVLVPTACGIDAHDSRQHRGEVHVEEEHHRRYVEPRHGLLLPDLRHRHVGLLEACERRIRHSSYAGACGAVDDVHSVGARAITLRATSRHSSMRRHVHEEQAGRRRLSASPGSLTCRRSLACRRSLTCRHSLT
jgi:hypothetical protein